MLTPLSAMLAISLTLSALSAGMPRGAAPQAPKPQPPARQPAGEPELPTYYFLLGRLLEGEGKIDEAAAALRKAAELEPKSAEPRAELAALYARADRAADAVSAAEAAIAVDPKNREANRILGSVLASYAAQRQAVKAGDDVSAYGARAMTALEIARGDGTGDLSIDLALARLYLERDRPSDAIPLLRRIVSEQPQYAEGSLLLAEAQEATGSPDAAIETLSILLEDQPQFVRGRVQLAELYDRQQKWEAAAQAWAAAQKLNARNTELMARRATSLMNGGRAAEARDVLREALKIAPSDVRLTFMLTQAQRDAGDLAAAEITARALQTAHPEDPRTTYLLAQVLDAGGRHQEIVDLLKPEIARLRTAKAKPGQVGLLLGAQGLALLQLKRYDEAIAVYRDAITASPDDTAIMFQFGAALDRAGRRPEAQKIFRDLIAKDPLDANALNYLGYMLAEQGTSLDEAVTLIQRALKVEPENPSYLDSLGWAYFQQGKLDLADPPLSAAAGRLPKNSVIQDHLGDLRLKQNRRAEAVEAWQRALAGDGDGIERAKIEKKIASAQKGGRH
jgi:tetratricopeptide (TPR) repeat protein